MLHVMVVAESSGFATGQGGTFCDGRLNHTRGPCDNPFQLTDLLESLNASTLHKPATELSNIGVRTRGTSRKDGVDFQGPGEYP